MNDRAAGPHRPRSRWARHVRLERGRLVVSPRVARALPAVVVGAALAAGLAAHAAYFAWLSDDAFISFRYARNLLEGRGLVFNAGERVEGYTNFLWVLEVAGLWAAGVRPEAGAWMLSGAFTVGTVWLALRLAAGTPHRALRTPVVLGTLALLATDRNVAVWTTGGGLETRQFTFLVLAAYLLLLGRRPRGDWGASLLFAAAALTRPEGPLFFGLALGLVVLDALRREGLELRRLFALVAPFALLVGGHLAFRLAYYGEWVPNTYFAKHVRPWPEMGLDYLTLAAIEGGLWLLVPLASIGVAARARAAGSLLPWTSLLWIGAHAVYLVVIGGDHFELRPLDVWWPLLFAHAAEGLAVSLAALRRRLSRSGASAVTPPAFTAALLVVLVYTRALQVAHELVTYELETRDETYRLFRPLGPEAVPFVHAIPWLGGLAEALDAVGARAAAHSVATRWREHAVFAALLREQYAPYEAADASAALPDDAVMAHGTVGILPFYLPDLTVVDTLGLTDPVVSRHGAPANRDRQMAHDRGPPPGYLEARGVNLFVAPRARSRAEALAAAPYALELRPGLFLPFLSERPEWVERAFAGRRLLRRDPPAPPADDRPAPPAEDAPR